MTFGDQVQPGDLYAIVPISEGGQAGPAATSPCHQRDWVLF